MVREDYVREDYIRDYFVREKFVAPSRPFEENIIIGRIRLVTNTLIMSEHSIKPLHILFSKVFIK